MGAGSGFVGGIPAAPRRWADTGNIAVYTTPAGNRRFLRASIDAMLPRPRQARRQSLTALGEPPDRVAAEFRRRVRGDLATQDWYSRFDEDSLRWFRERGMRMSELLLGHLDTTRAVGRDQLIAQAETLGREYGVEAKRHALSLGEATQAFLFFRARFMAEIANVARRRALLAEQASLLFAEADAALDRVILALIAGHQSA